MIVSVRTTSREVSVHGSGLTFNLGGSYVYEDNFTRENTFHAFAKKPFVGTITVETDGHILGTSVFVKVDGYEPEPEEGIS